MKITSAQVLKKIIKSKKKNINFKNNLAEVLDSIEMMDLITQIENKFKIKFKSKDISYKNFSSISKIEMLIKNVKIKK